MSTPAGDMTVPLRSALVTPRKIGTTRSVSGPDRNRLRATPITDAALTMISDRATNSRRILPFEAPKARAIAIWRVRPSISTTVMLRIPTQPVTNSTNPSRFTTSEKVRTVERASSRSALAPVGCPSHTTTAASSPYCCASAART